MSELIDFYAGAGKDRAGRKIEEIWMWEDVQLEEIHDYIQWLFPNRQPSMFNPDAPILTDEDAEKFRESSFLQARALRSFDRMSAFYHIGTTQCAYYGVKEGPPYWWDSLQYSHNWLRMTRILLFLNEIGLVAHATAFHEAISKATLPDTKTRSFWFKASGRPTDP